MYSPGALTDVLSGLLVLQGWMLHDQLGQVYTTTEELSVRHLTSEIMVFKVYFDINNIDLTKTLFFLCITNLPNVLSINSASTRVILYLIMDSSAHKTYCFLPFFSKSYTSDLTTG
jgi:hypothetical protein